MDSKWIMRGFGVEKMNYWRRVDQVALQAALLLGSWQGRMQAILQCQWVYGLNSGRPGASKRTWSARIQAALRSGIDRGETWVSLRY